MQAHLEYRLELAQMRNQWKRLGVGLKDSRHTTNNFGGTCTAYLGLKKPKRSNG